MTGGLDLSFGFPWNGKIPYPYQAAWSQPINRCPKGNKGNISRESWKARERLSLNKSLRKFGPIKLLCKHVTNPLKPATNCLCSPYKLVKQLGLGALWPCTTALVTAGALARVSNKLPILQVALSWKPSLFPLGDSDIGQNSEFSLDFSRRRLWGWSAPQSVTSHKSCKNCHLWCQFLESVSSPASLVLDLLCLFISWLLFLPLLLSPDT